MHGAAGGIGTSTLRLAPALGAARTIAVVSTEGKIAVAEAAGATDVVLADGFKDAVATLTDGRGVDIVLDPVGGDRFTDSLRSLAPAGRLLVVGFTGGDIPTIKVNRLLLNNVDAVGVGWGAWAMRHPGYLAEQWDELEALLASGKVSAPSRRCSSWNAQARPSRRWRIGPHEAKSSCGCAGRATRAPAGPSKSRCCRGGCGLRRSDGGAGAEPPRRRRGGPRGP